MTHLIVATHGKFSEELINSAAMVVGDLENTHAVTFLAGEGGDDLVEKYQQIISELPENEPILFLVDLFGGSPYNAAARVAAVRKNTDVIAGVSLPMLLEALDAKDSNDLEEIVTATQEASISSVKTFKTRQKEPSTKQKDKFQSPPCDLNAQKMNISLLRIDDRLIHGQVATSWAKAVKCEAIFAISDEVSQDELRRDLLLQVAPEHLKSYVISVEKAIKVYHNPKYAGKNILWLVTKPADILRLIEGGVEIKKVNVGGMTFKEGNKLLSDAVTVNAADVEAFKKLLELGVELFIQKVANNHKVDLTMKKLKEIQF